MFMVLLRSWMVAKHLQCYIRDINWHWTSTLIVNRLRKIGQTRLFGFMVWKTFHQLIHGIMRLTMVWEMDLWAWNGTDSTVGTTVIKKIRWKGPVLTPICVGQQPAPTWFIGGWNKTRNMFVDTVIQVLPNMGILSTAMYLNCIGLILLIQAMM